MIDNVIPYIGGEEEKSEREPLKIWGKIEGGEIVPAKSPNFTAQCLRVPVSDGHMAAVFVRFENKPTKEQILKIWKDFKGYPQQVGLPSAPKQFLNYFEEDTERSRLRLNRELSRRYVAISWSVVCAKIPSMITNLSAFHTIRSEAPPAEPLMAELLAKKGYMDRYIKPPGCSVRAVFRRPAL